MRTRKYQKGQFDVQPGMAFVMNNMRKLVTDGERIEAYKHPWLITEVYDDFVEVVMCRTMTCHDENKMYNNAWNDEVTEDILNPCPPMDSSNERISGMCLDTFTTLTKKELFSHGLRLLNENTETCNFTTYGRDSLCIRQTQLRIINRQISAWTIKRNMKEYDKRGCYEADINLEHLNYGEPVPEGFTREVYEKQFGWRHLPEADPNAVYPFEDKMHDYEKADLDILNAVRQRDGKLELTNDDIKKLDNNEPTL